MPDSSVFLSGSDINNHVGASVPVPTDSAGRTFPGGVLCPLCSHIHIPNGITPEGPAMVRLPWVNVTPRRPLGPCPIGTSYSDQTSCSKSTLALTPVCPWSVWLILGSEPLGASKPKGPTLLVLCSPLFPIPTRREDSQTRIPCPCSPVFLPFLRLFHLPSMKSNRNPLLSAHFGTLTWEISKEVIPSTTPSPSSWRNWGCWSDKEA